MAIFIADKCLTQQAEADLEFPLCDHYVYKVLMHQMQEKDFVFFSFSINMRLREK